MNNGLKTKKKTKEGKLVSLLVWGLIIFIALYIVYIAFLKKDQSLVLNDVSKDVFIVKTETVQKRDLKHQLMTSGSIKALEEAIIYPRISGKLQRNLLREGDTVRKNQTISLIDRDEVGAQYEPVLVIAPSSSLRISLDDEKLYPILENGTNARVIPTLGSMRNCIAICSTPALRALSLTPFSSKLVF